MKEIIYLVIPIVAVVISFLTYLLHRYKLQKFESNHLATLNQQVKELESDSKSHKENIVKIYGEIAEINKTLFTLKGKINGK